MKRASVKLLSVSLLLLALCAGPTLSPAQPLSPPPGGGGGGGGGTPHWQLTITRSGSTTVTVKDADDNIVTPPSGTYNWNDPEPLPSMEVGYTVTINSAGTYTVTAVWLDASGNPAIPPPDQRLLHLRLTPHSGWSVTVNYDQRNQYDVLSHSADDGWADEEIVTNHDTPGGTAVKNGASDGRRLITLDGSSGSVTYTCPQQQAGISVHSTGASGPVGAGCSLTAEVWAWGADLKSVAYAGDHQYTVQEDKSDHPAYGTPHWQDNSSPLNSNASDPAGAINGDGTINTSGDQRYPVCVRRTITGIGGSSKLWLSAAIEFSPGLPAGTQQNQCKIKGRALDTDGKTTLFTVGIPQGNQATIDGNQLQINNVICTVGDLTYAFPPSVEFINPLKICWQFTLDNGATWYDAGASDNRVYVIGGENPPAPSSTFLETVLDIACRNTQGKTTDTEIVPALFSAFVGPVPGVLCKPMDGHNKTDGAEMKYWPEGYNSPNHWTTLDLVTTHDGRCGSWARLLIDTLAVHGIASRFSDVTPNVTPDAYPGPPAGVGWTLGDDSGMPQGFMVMSIDNWGQLGNPGQGNSGPRVTYKTDGSGLPDHFSDHMLVLVDGVTGPPDLTINIYDPSYAVVQSGAATLALQERAYQNATFTGLYRIWVRNGIYQITTSPPPTQDLWTNWP